MQLVVSPVPYECVPRDHAIERVREVFNASSTGVTHAVYMLGMHFGTVLSRHSKTTKVRKRHRQSPALHAVGGFEKTFGDTATSALYIGNLFCSVFLPRPGSINPTLLPTWLLAVCEPSAKLPLSTWPHTGRSLWPTRKLFGHGGGAREEGPLRYASSSPLHVSLT